MRGPNTAYRPRPEEAQGMHFTAPSSSGGLERTGHSTEVATAEPNELVPVGERGLAVPQEPETDQEPLRIVLTGLDKNIDNFAREAAHEKLSKKHEGGFWKRAAKSVWHNLTREYQVVKATQEAREEILESGNLRHHHGETDEKWRESVVRRYGSEFGEHLVHEEAGETFRKLGAPEAAEDPNAERIRSGTLDLLREYAKGNMDDASLELAQKEMFEIWREEGISQQYIGEGQLLAHNISEMARQVKAALDAREGLNNLQQDAYLDQLLANAEIVTGEAKVGSRVEMESTLSERLAEKLKGVPFLNEGRLAAVTAAVSNETVVAAMLSVAAYGAKGMVTKAGAMLVPGLGAGVVAFMRERRALRDERALTARRLDAGQEIDADEKAQVELGETMYETRAAGELLDELGGLYNEHGELNITDRAGLENAMRLQAEIQARIQIEDRDGKRLINFADISSEEMEGRRFDIDLAMAKLEVDMQKLFANPVAQGMLDITPEQTYEKWSSDEKSTMIGMLKGEMTAQDRLFQKIVGWRGFKKAVAATLIGGAIGLAINEIHQGGRNVKQFLGGLFRSSPEATDIELVGQSTTLGTPDQVGEPGTPDAVGGATPDSVGGGTPDQVGATRVTPDQVGGQETPGSVGTEATTPGSVGESPETPGYVGNQEGILSDTSKISQLPEGYTIARDGNVAVLTGPDGDTLRLELNKDGSLSESAHSTLNQAGFNVMDRPDVVAGEPDVSRVEVTPGQFVENHREDMVEIADVRWMHNLTEGSNLNELGLHNDLQSNGNIVVSIAGMTSGGSFDQAGSLDWQEAAREGHLSVFLSASPGTRAHAIEIPIRPDGTAVIEKGSPAAALFNEDGKFIGGYQQAAVKEDLGEGRVRIASLATVVGENRPDTFTDTVETPTVETAHTYVITEVEQAAVYTPEAPIDNFVPTAPLLGRRRIGEANEPPAPEPEAPAPIAALPAAPQSPELQAAAAAAESRGLPSASQPAAEQASTTGERTSQQSTTTTGGPTPQPGPQATGAGAPGTQGSPEGRSSNPYEGFAPEEIPYVKELDDEQRELPRGYFIDLKGYSDRQRKLVIKAIYEAEQRFPRGAGENEFGYRRRVIRELQGAGQVGLSQIGAVPAGLRPIFEGAFRAMADIRMARARPSAQQSRAA